MVISGLGQPQEVRVYRDVPAPQTMPPSISSRRSRPCASRRSVADLCGDAQIVGDEQHRKPEPLEVFAAGRRTCACTETSSAETGFVRDQNLGIERERACDPDALALAAGEFVRIAVDCGLASRPTSSSSSRARCQRLAQGSMPCAIGAFCDDACRPLRRGLSDA